MCHQRGVELRESVGRLPIVCVQQRHEVCRGGLQAEILRGPLALAATGEHPQDVPCRCEASGDLGYRRRRLARLARPGLLPHEFALGHRRRHAARRVPEDSHWIGLGGALLLLGRASLLLLLLLLCGAVAPGGASAARRLCGRCDGVVEGAEEVAGGIRAAVVADEDLQPATDAASQIVHGPRQKRHRIPARHDHRNVWQRPSSIARSCSFARHGPDASDAQLTRDLRTRFGQGG
mmetsp:Transcript_55290/g.140234  ORF Transcript_55290/g.140234 Transcript_55290/m.140234 type:complete len:235 (+) Transcript_55290:910-1614(+)